VDQVVAQRDGIGERPKRHCVFYHSGHAVKVRDVAKRDDQVIVFELELAGTEPGADGYNLPLQIDVLDLTHDQISARAKASDRRNYIGQTDRPRDDFREHRLIDPIVLAIDQCDRSLLRA
jgi:hypothetical protein